jgi:hypothetical protein
MPVKSRKLLFSDVPFNESDFPETGEGIMFRDIKGNRLYSLPGGGKVIRYGGSGDDTQAVKNLRERTQQEENRLRDIVSLKAGRCLIIQ